MVGELPTFFRLQLWSRPAYNLQKLSVYHKDGAITWQFRKIILHCATKNTFTYFRIPSSTLLEWNKACRESLVYIIASNHFLWRIIVWIKQTTVLNNCNKSNYYFVKMRKKRNMEDVLTSCNRSHSFSILASIKAISFQSLVCCGVEATPFCSDPREPFTKCFLSNFSRGVSYHERATIVGVYIFSHFEPKSRQH